MAEDGVIKFSLDWVETPAATDPADVSAVQGLDAVRSRLFACGLVGCGADRIGYGNVSVRVPVAAAPSGPGFWISGTQTGHLNPLGLEGYTRVWQWDPAANRLACRGPLKASSESMTHAVLYDAAFRTGCVLHVHHLGHWRRLLHKVPTTAAEVPYGTPAMAAEMLRLWAEGELPERRILAMGGHEEGLIALGADPGDAWAVLVAEGVADTVSEAGFGR